MSDTQQTQTPTESMSTVETASSRMRESKSVDEYKKFIQHNYDGLPGAFTSISGIITGHELLAGQLINRQAFDVRGCKRILDAACGNGRYSKYLLRQADPDATIDAFDLSPNMLQRARARVKSDRVSYVVADMTKLPYADATFDAAVCGWALEHLPDPTPGLQELSRVLAPGGKFLLLCTEDTFTGRWCSRLYHCRTYKRDDLRRRCEEVGLEWVKEHWFSGIHRWLGLGGIIVELRRGETVASVAE